MQERFDKMKDVDRDAKPTIKNNVSKLFKKNRSLPTIVNSNKNESALVHSSGATLFKAISNSDDPNNYDKFDPSASNEHTQEYFYSTALQSVKVKSTGYLRLDCGDLVRVYSSQKIIRGTFDHVTCGDSAGRVLVSGLNIDIHTCNVYLEAIDMLVQQPTLLAELLEGSCEDYPDRDRHLVMLLKARRLFQPTLEALLDVELSRASGREKNIALRQESPALAIMLSELHCDPAVTQFCESWIGHIKKSIKQKAKKGVNNPEVIAAILQDSFNCTKQMDIPASISLVLKTIKKISEKYFSVAEQNSQMGSIIFLRLICPRLISPLNKQNHTENKSALMIAKALQFISNQVDPSSNDVLLYDSSSVLHSFYASCESLLSRITDTQITINAHPTPLIKEAASFYGFMLKQLEPHLIDNSLMTALVNRLGQPPARGLVENEASLPMFKTINRIAHYIESTRILNSAVPRVGGYVM